MPPRVAVYEAEFIVVLAARATAMGLATHLLGVSSCIVAALAILSAIPALGLQVTDPVLITEVHYDPPETPETSYEFIEITNAGTITVYLDGAVITDEGNDGAGEATFQFPGTPLTGTTLPLAPGEALLLVPDAIGCPYSGVDFEFYAGTNDSDHPTVPNLVKTSGLAADLYLANTGDGITLSVGITSGNILPCSEIIDGVSWETGGAPDVTATSSTVCADPTPHLGIDNIMRSLQRCPGAPDTNVSSADFSSVPRSPGIPNVCVFPPPNIGGAETSPCVPQAGQPVLLSAIVTDGDANLVSVFAFYRLRGVANFDSIALAPTVGDLFQAWLPGQPNQSLIEWYVRARDAHEQVTLFPDAAPAALALYRVGQTPISTVQSSVAADSCASSTFAGTPIHVVGVVTHHALEFSASYFYLQNGIGPFAGICVVGPDGEFVPQIGDSLLVSGIVAESNCATQIILNLDCVQILGTNRKVRARTLASPSLVANEAHEGMLVRIPVLVDVLTGFDSIPGNATAGREFSVSDGGPPLWVGDDTFMPDGIGYWYTPTPRDQLESLAGIVAGRAPSPQDPQTRWRLEPRRDPDLDVLITSDAPATPVAAGNVDRLTLEPNLPNPFNPSTTIGFAVPGPSRARLAVHDARGRRVRLLFDREFTVSTRDRVLWDGRDDAGGAMPSGVYWIRLQSSADTTARSRKIVLAR